MVPQPAQRPALELTILIALPTPVKLVIHIVQHVREAWCHNALHVFLAIFLTQILAKIHALLELLAKHPTIPVFLVILTARLVLVELLLLAALATLAII